MTRVIARLTIAALGRQAQPGHHLCACAVAQVPPRISASLGVGLSGGGMARHIDTVIEGSVMSSPWSHGATHEHVRDGNTQPSSHSYYHSCSQRRATPHRVLGAGRRGWLHQRIDDEPEANDRRAGAAPVGHIERQMKGGAL